MSEKEENGESSYSSVIVTGTSGIGKTCFGFYLAHQLISEGHVVAYNYRNRKRMVFAPSITKLRANATKAQAEKKADEGQT
jgi:KaiC/GvpD/RAD55 family RecA-like ATPase